MLKKTLTYTTFDDEGEEKTVTGDFYFSLTEAELVKMNFSKQGGLEGYFKQIAATEDIGAVLQIFEMFISQAYGQRSADGSSFMKDPEKTKWFLGTQAYSDLFIEFATDAKKGAEFLIEIVPKHMRGRVTAAQLEATVNPPAYVKEKRTPRKDEFKNMTKAQMAEAIRKLQEEQSQN